MSVRTWVIAQRVALAVVLAPIPFIPLLFTGYLWIAVGLIWLIGAIVVGSYGLDPNRSWWAPEVLAHGKDTEAMRRDRRGHFQTLGVLALSMILIPALLVVTGLYRLFPRFW